ncbi:alternative ribosome rescue factor ArfA [Rhizobium sp. BK176]|uniref:alternative ribosome rescue factor ArfA n=1 Tax=Rhizobium sp. BK176 TaxID=2587071 RepID=UPI002A4540C3|nr:stalled ribosome alternative rescue factor ArfA [Rhizobium sp. BK176]
MGKKNPVAFVLRTPVFRPRKTKVVKGKGSYTRKTRHRSGRTDGVFFVSGFRHDRAYFPPKSSFLIRPFRISTK